MALGNPRTVGIEFHLRLLLCVFSSPVTRQVASLPTRSKRTDMGCDPFNQNFRAEVRKSECIATKQSYSIPRAKRVSHSFKMEDVGSLLLVLELDDDFDGDSRAPARFNWKN